MFWNRKPKHDEIFRQELFMMIVSMARSIGISPSNLVDQMQNTEANLDFITQMTKLNLDKLMSKFKKE